MNEEVVMLGFAGPKRNVLYTTLPMSVQNIAQAET